MALICMAVHDTANNGRTEFTKQTLQSLKTSVDWVKHRIVIIENGGCEESNDVIDEFRCAVEVHCWPTECPVTVIKLPTNIGTANAVNKGLALRRSGEYVVKMDNDVVIYNPGWIEQMQEVMERMPSLGILGLKRRDLLESPYAINTDQRSRLLEVPHVPGQRWYVVEECKHVMGTCTMLSPQLLDRVGFFYQCGGLYGFDDSLMCVRSSVAGFTNGFIHGIDIAHIDPGGTEYTDWKAKAAGEMLTKYAQEEALYKTGAKDVYYGGSGV